MAASLILYGSRARGEARVESDVDLILANDGMSLGRPSSARGLSVHLYSKDWLKAEARAGNLFAYHVAYEGLALSDEDNFLAQLRNAFQKKDSYRSEIDIAVLVLKLMLEKDWDSNLEARRRYFWALRTIAISDAADNGRFIFSSAELELYAGIDGLSSHIDNRDNAVFCDCLDYGSKILDSLSNVPDLESLQLRNKLLGLGGIARDSVRIVEEEELIEMQSLAVYL